MLAEDVSKKVLTAPLPTRDAQLQALQNGDEYDMLIIGGGATGCGVALDAVSRGKCVITLLSSKCTVN